MAKPTACLIAAGTTHGFCRTVQHEPAAMAWVEAGIAGFRQILDRPD